jgi:tetratricopeptide (TPR) repeat protein
VRLDATVAHLELAGQRLDDAMLHYHQALERSPHYGEARLGLGIALMTLSLRDADPDLVRKRALEALGQFANVDRGDPVYLAAFYDRVLLLTRVGRTREAARLLSREPAIPATGRWAERFRRLRAGL